MRSSIAIVACAGCAAAAPPAPPRGPTATTTPPVAATCRDGRTVIVVRHAEKAAEGGKDPALSALGEDRARRLAATLGPSRVTHLFASEYRRTQQTLAPLAAKHGLEIAVRPAADHAALARELLGRGDGSLAVVATHSNVIPGLVRALGGAGLAGVAPDAEALAEDDFNRLVVLAFGCGAPRPVQVELRQAPPP